jgi:hypothetical protein
MHARLEQLLSLRDGDPVDATIRDHVAGCVACAAELTHLATTREHLLSLPMLDPPNQLWGQISARIGEVGSRSSKSRPIWISLGAAAAALIAAVLVHVGGPHESRVALRADATSSQTQLTALVQRSQQLEAELDALPQRPSVERVATAVNIDGIEQRIQWLDFHLSAANDVLDQMQTQQLWQERVNLMDSLVKLRYAEARVAQL